MATQEKPLLKIQFTDLWRSFDPVDNYIHQLLSTVYQLELSTEPDVLIYGRHGQQYLQYNCLRIFYTGENVRPDFSACDYALTFDYLQHSRHFRWPLYVHYINYYNAWQQLQTPLTREEATAIWQQKNKFCCMVVSNPACDKRIDFFHQLSAVKQVDSGGRYLNNVGGPIADKMAFIKDYKFVIAFENSAYPGYTTEKIVEPMMVHSIPVYWGNELVHNDFNPASFIWLNKTTNMEAVIQQMLEIDRNPELGINLLMQPVLNNNEYFEGAKAENVLPFLVDAIESRHQIALVANNPYKRKLHRFKKLYAFKKRKLQQTTTYKMWQKQFSK